MQRKRYFSQYQSPNIVIVPTSSPTNQSPSKKIKNDGETVDKNEPVKSKNIISSLLKDQMQQKVQNINSNEIVESLTSCKSDKENEFDSDVMINDQKSKGNINNKLEQNNNSCVIKTTISIEKNMVDNLKQPKIFKVTKEELSKAAKPESSVDRTNTRSENGVNQNTKQNTTDSNLSQGNNHSYEFLNQSKTLKCETDDRIIEYKDTIGPTTTSTTIQTKTDLNYNSCEKIVKDVKIDNNDKRENDCKIKNKHPYNKQECNILINKLFTKFDEIVAQKLKGKMCDNFKENYSEITITHSDYYPLNLQQVLQDPRKKFNIDQIRQLGIQLVAAVVLLRNNNIVHCDIKPSHILFDITITKLKLCGFDEAYYYSYSNNLSANAGTLNYRPPELILGYSNRFSIDVWSTALVMYEMATKSMLFPGTTNNNILFKQMSILGRLPDDMIQWSRFKNEHFNGTAFIKITGSGARNEIRINNFTKRSTTITTSIFNAFSNDLEGMINAASKLVLFSRLIEKMLVLHPKNRLTIEYVYANAFFSTK
ncbi:unnamed protein product [Parnassius apollo]|uniref:(apollo) hypothetical protein n=1 Tax=Parnassius apollo TaxID=110799 RepID=A0A8S3VZX7_PARAO|nr:unnamed protein product [Parnassius apollo]